MTPAEAWAACCDQFAAEQVSDGVVAWVRKNGPDA